MKLWFINVAALNLGHGVFDSKSISFAAKEMTIVLCGIVVLALVLIVWAAIFWKKRRRRRHHRHYHHGSAEVDTQPEVAAAKSESHRSGRSRHQKYRRRFPTLAQTGGLPPKRPVGPDPIQPPGSSAPS